MRLYFLRHASASDVAVSDAERALTNHGKEEARIAGAALHELGVEPARVFTSPLLRAQQTGAIAADAMKIPASHVEVIDELDVGQSSMALFRALKSTDEADEIVLVGHMPSLVEHIGALIGAKGAVGLSLGKGSIACVEAGQLKVGAGELRWLMRQKQLAKIAR